MTNLVLLSGGLGNQLFQINAALSISKNSHLIVETGLIGARSVRGEKQPIQEFRWPENVIFRNTVKFRRVSRLVLKYLLGRSVNNSGRAKATIFKIPLTLLSAYFYFLYGKFFAIELGEGVGYKALVSNKQELLIIGYFQSYRYKNDSVLPELDSRSSKTQTTKNIIELEFKNQPIIVHVRLGDYLNEPNIGVLHPSYFIEAVKTLRNQGLEVNPIWILSDNLALARKYLHDLDSKDCYWVESSDWSPAFVISTLRDGAGYVISNSTFSWWAAYARKNPNAKVIAPSPWFKNLKEPLDLIPESWIRMPSNFQSWVQNEN